MAHGFLLFYFVLVLSRQLAFQVFFSSSHHEHSKDAGPNIAPGCPLAWDSWERGPGGEKGRVPRT